MLFDEGHDWWLRNTATSAAVRVLREEYPNVPIVELS